MSYILKMWDGLYQRDIGYVGTLVGAERVAKWEVTTRGLVLVEAKDVNEYMPIEARFSLEAYDEELGRSIRKWYGLAQECP